MNADRVDLRERMRSLTIAELRKTAANRDGDQDPGEVAAAQEELTLRFSPLHEGPIAYERKPNDDAMPIGLRIVFYLAVCAAVLAIFVIVFFVSVFLAGNLRLNVVVEAIIRFGVPAAIAIWIASAIRSERRYARGLLLTLFSAGVVGRLTLSILTGQFTYRIGIVLGVLTVAFCYFAFSNAIRNYYRALSDADRM